MSDRGRGYGQVLAALEAELAAWAGGVDPAKFYDPPEPGAWSVMENLAHAVEFLRYWADQVHVVVQRPGQPFGRTHDDAERIAWVAEHGKDDPNDVLAALHQSARYAADRLADVPDAAWDTATGIHANRGPMTLPAIVEFFLTDHLRAHLHQAQDAQAGAAR